MSCRPETTAAQAGGRVDAVTGAVTPPLHPSTTFARGAEYELVGDHIYSRYGHPTLDRLETVCAHLDGGTRALAFSSGMAAVAAVLETVPPGGHVVAPQVMYHGAQEWMRRLDGSARIRLTLCDAADPGALAAAIGQGDTDMVWIETPSNPMWEVVDIAGAAALADASGALLVVDSTVAPPVTTRPLEHGAGLVFHSGTKYLNGHGDLTAGVLVTGAVDDRWRHLGDIRTLAGSVLPPFETWLLLRGLRTLFLRYRRASDSALRIARHLAEHPMVERVLYPGLVTHPRHELAARQMTGGFGGMLSILIRGDAATARRIATAVQVFVPATSLGGVESLIEHRASIEGDASTVPENLLRLSIGIEHPDDLVADLDQALARG